MLDLFFYKRGFSFLPENINKQILIPESYGRKVNVLNKTKNVHWLYLCNFMSFTMDEVPPKHNVGSNPTFDLV